jgi:hypothetical protein
MTHTELQKLRHYHQLLILQYGSATTVNSNSEDQWGQGILHQRSQLHHVESKDILGKLANLLDVVNQVAYLIDEIFLHLRFILNSEVECKIMLGAIQISFFFFLFSHN